MDKDSDQEKDDLEKDCENSPCGSSMGFDGPETPYGKRSSPACVKWDFDLPPVSDKIKEEAKALGQELKKPCPPRKRNTRRHSPYFTRLKYSNETPMKSLSYCRSIKLLKEAISGKTNKNEVENDEVKASMSLKVTEDNNRSSPDMFEDGSSEKSGTSKPIANSDLFDDFFNDILNECSQEVEQKVNVQDIPKQDKELSHKLTTEEHYARSGITKTPKTANRKSLSREFKSTPRNLIIELDEADDDLFLEIDL